MYYIHVGVCAACAGKHIALAKAVLWRVRQRDKAASWSIHGLFSGRQRWVLSFVRASLHYLSLHHLCGTTSVVNRGNIFLFTYRQHASCPMCETVDPLGRSTSVQLISSHEPYISICQVLHLLHSCSRTNTMYVWVFPLYWIAAVAHSSFIVFAHYVQQNCEIRIELWSWDAVTECTATLSQPDLSAEHVFWCNLCLHLNNESRVLASPGLFCVIHLLLSLGCIKYK